MITSRGLNLVRTGHGLLVFLTSKNQKTKNHYKTVHFMATEDLGKSVVFRNLILLL